MKEINYQIFDKESKLPFKLLTDEFIRTISDYLNQSYSETFNEIKKDINRKKIIYFKSNKTNKIEPISESRKNRMNEEGLYYKTYKEAING